MHIFASPVTYVCICVACTCGYMHVNVHTNICNFECVYGMQVGAHIRCESTPNR